ncbi:MAG: tetratricopeptide repeat protein [Neptuniibacter sp.]
MRWFSRLIAPLVFMIAYTMFRSSVQKKSRKKHDLVMKLFRFAADNGHQKALSVYGHLLHFRGDGPENRIQGGIYLQQAAEKGDYKAQYQMGRIYEEGFEHYFQIDQFKALSYYTRAAEHGHQLAIKRLVDIFSEGELGQSVSREEALKWQSKLPAIH